MDRFHYMLLMAGCLLVTLPLEFWLAARVYRRPRRLLLAVVPVALAVGMNMPLLANVDGAKPEHAALVVMSKHTSVVWLVLVLTACQ